MSNVGEYIKKLRIKKGLTQEELGDMIGVKRAAVNKWESGLVQNLKRTTIQKLADIFDVSPSSFIDGECDTVHSNFDILSKTYANIHPIHLKRFPLVGEIACGRPIYAEEDKESYVMADMDIDADFCLVAKGDSMINARIYNGDIVFIREMPMVNNGEIAAVIIDDEATLKRVYYYPEKNKLVLNPENPSYEPLVYIGEELNEIRILGKAVYFMSLL